MQEVTPFPLLGFTIINRTGVSQVVNACEIAIEPLLWRFAEAPTRELTPGASWDVIIPSSQKAIHQFKPPYPILISHDDAFTIDIRILLKTDKGMISLADTGDYNIIVTFLSDQGLRASSESITV